MIVTHESLGQAYNLLVKHIFGIIPDNIVIAEVGSRDLTDEIHRKLNEATSQLRSGIDTLILTDIFGATPFNIARKLIHNDRTLLLTGLNAPMMIKAIQNSVIREDVAVLANEVKAAAIAGIMTVSYENSGNPL